MDWVIALLFPWPTPQQRKAAIADADEKMRRADRDLSSTRKAQRELEDAVYHRNHFADVVAGTLGMTPAQFREAQRRMRHHGTGG
jgi:methylphosphotriester-DNA--protein-cysteine methyltransferase